MQLTALITAFIASVAGFPLCSENDKHHRKPAAFFLAGDSTTAPRGGWGDSFLELLVNNATGINWAKGGATTASFIAEGLWASVINSVEEHKENYQPYVTIQFGHNDQKPENNVSLSLFESNLKDFVSQVRKAGGIPILVTSLTRRTFSKGQVVQNLAVQANITLSVAAQTRSPFIDLNKASTVYVQAIGSSNADLYNLSPSDRTHLNGPGGVLFANMVGSLTDNSTVGWMVERYIGLNETIVKAIETGVFILPSNRTVVA